MSINTNSFEQKTIKKITWKIMPFILLLYIVAYIDRVNLGYAALEMNTDLALSAEAFGMLAGIFFIGYFLFEVPSNILLEKFGAKVWIARIMISWGIVVILTGFVQSEVQLYILRFLLGVAEAGFFPGIILYLTYWFRTTERGRTYSTFLIAMPAATIIGAPLSTWIMDNITWFSVAGWRWMFIIEGVATIFFGIICLLYLSNRPSEAKWLTREEKNWIETELEKENQAIKTTSHSPKKEIFKNPILWKLAFFYFILYCGQYGLSFWLPTMLSNLSSVLSNTTIGLLTMIPPIVAIPVMIWWGRHSDRTAERKMHVILPVMLSAIGFIGNGITSDPYITIIFVTMIQIGFFSFIGPFLALLSRSFNKAAAAVGIALVNSIASLGGFFGPALFGYFTYHTGMFFVCALLVIGCLPLMTIKNKKSQLNQPVIISEEKIN